jgi:hypothetical protein
MGDLFMLDELDVGKGLRSAVQAAHDPNAPVPDVLDGEQLALMPLRNAGQGVRAAEILGSATRGPGRPPGAKNKNTEAWTRFLLSRYPSPLQGLAEVAFRPLGDLAAEVLELAGAAPGARPTYDRLVELLKIQLGAMKELAPYLHQKQPMAIQGAENGLINLFIGDVSVAQVSTKEATNFDLEIFDIESEQNQVLSDPSEKNSNAQESNV